MEEIKIKLKIFLKTLINLRNIIHVVKWGGGRS